MTTSWTCLSLGLSLGAGLLLLPHPAAAQQITQGGGTGGGNSGGIGATDGAGGIAGGGGGAGGGAFGLTGAGGSAAQAPGGSASPGGTGDNGAGGRRRRRAPGTPNDLAAGGGGGGGIGSFDSASPGDGGAGGAGGSGTVLGTTGPFQFGADHGGGAGAAGLAGTGGLADRGGNGGGAGGLVLAGAGAMLDTSGFNVTGGSGGGGSRGGGGGGAGLVLLDGGTITVATGAGGTSAITGGQGGGGGESGDGGAGLLLYNGGTLSHQAGTITGGAGGSGQYAGHGGAGVLSNQGAIDNRATITGGRSGDANAGHTVPARRSGGAGLEAWGGTVANTATGVISGGAGGNQISANPVYAAGAGGAGVVFRDGQTASLSNAGTISGGTGGTVVAGSNFGPGGVGIVGAASGGISIINSGSISGGLSGDGVRANAVELFGSDNRFEMWAGSVTNGNVVVAPGGTNNVLALGGATNGSVDLSNLTSSHTGFTAFEKTGTSTWALAGAGSQNWTVREGTLSGSTASMAGNLTFATGPGTRAVVFNQGSDGTYSGTISGDGSFTKTNTGTLTLAGVQSYTGDTTISAGTLRMGTANALTSSAGIILQGSSTWDLNGYDQTVKRLEGNAPGTAIKLGAAILTIDNSAFFVFRGDISGSGGLTKTGSAGLNIFGTNTYSGPTSVAGGTLRIGQGGSILNSTAINISNGARFVVFEPNALSSTGAVSLTGAGSQFETLFDQRIGSLAGGADTNVILSPGVVLTTGANNTSTIFSGTIGSIFGDGSLTKVGTGSFTLNGVNTYEGATLVNAGSLIVNGSIAASSSVTVAAGATLGGAGVVPTTVINGGTLSPGNSPGTLTVRGDLTLNAGSTYLAEVQGANADRVDVSGTASLAGTLRIVPLGGAYTFSSPYTLLSATGGRTGTFSPVDTTGSFGDGVTTTVSYTSNDVQLTLTPKPLTPVDPPVMSPGPGFIGVTGPKNAYAIGRAIDRAVADGADPSSLFGIYNLPAASIPAAVNSLSGEVHTAAPAMANAASDQFLRVMLDPTAMGRLGDAGAAGPGAAAFSGLARKGADRPAGPSRLDLPFYSVWGSAYGSHGRTDGSAYIGSARRTIDDAHLATGIDVRLQPGTVAGVALSGGKARASLPGVIGKVDAEVFQAGLYGVTQLGPVRLGAALSYARLENDIRRSIPVLGSSLSSSYATTAWSGRLQASAALLNWNGLSLSPLAAIQATRARSPALIEANWAGANAGALALAKRGDVTARSELGLQLDADTVLGGVAVTGYVRVAWAHYFRRDADLTANLIGLPGASFTATGAQADRNSALVGVGAMARLSERVTLGLSLDSELSANSSRIGGSAQLRVSF
ncbi:autotransporter domain-containing protein [Bosea vestrisii]|uniref:autotransporter domain-containing protein n=1 Tax=Bosea vestrisii TaxID=151416 RepID=UPI0024DF6D45|nr:autotransporter domain-containing protein [Bosea vestrisii]WID97154.1 autotransporter domain-containing protein [Bosea vestrisii]